MPINSHTIKSQYSVHRIEQMYETIVRPEMNTFFSTDASNGHWSVPVRKEDCYKA